MAFSYKNTSGYKLVIPAVGEVEPNEVITSEQPLENQYLEPVSQTQQQAQPAQVQPAAEQPKEEVKA